MKKNLTLLAVLMAASVSTGLVGCGDASQSEEPKASSEEVKESASEQISEVAPQEELVFDTTKNVKLTIYTTLSATSNYGKVFDEYLLTKFHDLYPNISITHERCGGFDDVRDKIKTEITTPNGGPNLAYCYPDHVALYNKARVVQTFDKFMYNTQTDDQGNLLFGLTDEQVDDFIPAYLNEGRDFGDGLTYSLPLYKSTEVLYYNEDAFREAGLVDDSDEIIVPDHWFKNGENDKTAMEYTCEVLKSHFPDCIPLGYDSEANWFITMCEQYNSPFTSATGDHFLFDNQTNRDFVTKFKGWYEKGYVTTQQIYGSYTSGLFCNTTDNTQARSFMSIGSSAGATHQVPTDGSFMVGIAPIPQVDAENSPAVISQGPSLCMFKKTDQQEVIATWLLTRFLTTNQEFQASMSMSSGYVAGIQSVNDIPAYAEFLDSADGTADNIAALSAKVCMEQADWYFTSPAFVGSSDARDEVGSLIPAVFLGNKTVDQAFKDAIATCIANNQ